jgi:hypothetical protein
MASQDAPLYDPRGSMGASFRAPSQASGPTVLYLRRVGRCPLSIRATADGCKASPRRRRARGLPAAGERVDQQPSRTMAREVTWETGTSA